MVKHKTKQKTRRQNAQSKNSCYGSDGCLLALTDGCLYTDGCNNSDGCLSFDGCNPLDFDGCTSMFFVPFRLLVILGLMLYGDWDYKNGCAKSSKITW